MKQELKPKVTRTTEGTIFELVFLGLAILSWVYIVLQINALPDRIPTHFDIAGRPNGYGTPLSLYLPCIISTVAGACLMAGAYFPSTINIPFRLRNTTQWSHVIRMMRILGLLILLMAPMIVFSAKHTVADASHTSLFFIVYVGFLLLFIIGYLLFIYSKRHE